jgi:hypothetical protein
MSRVVILGGGDRRGRGAFGDGALGSRRGEGGGRIVSGGRQMNVVRSGGGGGGRGGRGGRGGKHSSGAPSARDLDKQMESYFAGGEGAKGGEDTSLDAMLESYMAGGEGKPAGASAAPAKPAAGGKKGGRGAKAAPPTQEELDAELAAYSAAAAAAPAPEAEASA